MKKIIVISILVAIFTQVGFCQQQNISQPLAPYGGALEDTTIFKIKIDSFNAEITKLHKQFFKLEKSKSFDSTICASLKESQEDQDNLLSSIKIIEIAAHIWGDFYSFSDVQISTYIKLKRVQFEKQQMISEKAILELERVKATMYYEKQLELKQKRQKCTEMILQLIK